MSSGNEHSRQWEESVRASETGPVRVRKNTGVARKAAESKKVGASGVRESGVRNGVAMKSPAGYLNILEQEGVSLEGFGQSGDMLLLMLEKSPCTAS